MRSMRLISLVPCFFAGFFSKFVLQIINYTRLFRPPLAYGKRKMAERRQWGKNATFQGKRNEFTPNWKSFFSFPPVIEYPGLQQIAIG